MLVAPCWSRGDVLKQDHGAMWTASFDRLRMLDDRIEFNSPQDGKAYFKLRRLAK
jgi:hypothetical protein